MSSSNPNPQNPGDMEEPVLTPHFLSPGGDTSSSLSSNSNSQHSDSPRNDWMLQGSVWSQLSDPKSQTLDDVDVSMNLDFPGSLSQQQWSSMDMDADISTFMADPLQHFSLDPNTLHLEGSVFNESAQEQIPPENYDTMFQFALSQPTDAPQGSTAPFQLPTPNPGSMSSRSVSPALSKPDSDSSTGVNPNDLNLFTQLGHRARDAAGVTLAVPVGRDSRGTTEGPTPVTPVSPVPLDSQVSQQKVPIPRLRPTAIAFPKPQILTASQPTPPSSQHASSPPSVSQDNFLMVPTTKTGRPKASHTTIERRYRTNLNARILALRRAVPALRILEKHTTTQTQGKGLTGATAPKWDFGELSSRRPFCKAYEPTNLWEDDLVNERGFVDGVKAARKNSKGIVLSKAVEYIKALKRRETRLKREAEGLRSLITSLVGGPELLREWEKEWRERFGGEEADEVDEDVNDNEDGDGDGDDGDDAEDGDSDEDNGRAKKRARLEKERKQKATPAPAPAPAPPTGKRKRGRPRKNPVPDIPAVRPPHLVLQPPDIAAQRQPSNYLLAVFLLFNFFNPNPPVPQPTEAHTGMVLSHALSNTTSAALMDSTGWTTLQAINMLVSMLLLLSLLGPYIPKKLAHLLPDTLLFASPSTSSSRAQKTGVHDTPTRDVQISCALVSGDEHALRSALGVDGSLYSVVKTVALIAQGRARKALQIQRSAEGVVTRLDEIELRGWRRVSQMEVLRGKSTPLLRIQGYLSFSSKLLSSASPSDKMTLALLAYHFATPTATRLWETARRSDMKTSSETLVLEMTVEEAATIITTAQSPLFDPSDDDSFSPVHRIAAHVVLSRTRTLAGRQFVSSVSGHRLVDLDNETSEGTATSFSCDNEAKPIIAAGRELGGPLGELTQLLEKVDRCSAAEVLATLPSYRHYIEHDDYDDSPSDGGAEDNQRRGDAQFEDALKGTRLLLLATLLYRRIFPAEDASSKHVLSPPPSPTLNSAELQLALRRTLASSVFDADPDTEDARDQVVDILAEMTRRGRSGLY